ncbi:glycosyltransferase [Pedococcus aerophilus]|uniref:Glycosyltransferase n=1 Tax=Pedococcus aerophilus TaxID=436356 RepID=A0ABN3UYV7_9MICO
MKVLYVLKRYPRLSETFVVREILGVEARGVTVLVDALLPPEDEPRHPEVDRVRALVRYLPRRPVRRHVLVAAAHLAVRRPVPLATEVLRAARRVRRLRRAGDQALARKVWRQLGLSVLVADRARSEGVTQVHCHFATAACDVGVPAAAMAGVPSSVTVHAKDLYHRDNVEELPLRLARASAVVTVSAYNLEHLGTVLGPARRPLLRHVPNGVALGEVNLDGVGDRAAPVLCVSRLVAKKGIDTLLRALALAAVDDEGLRLEVIGGGPLDAELMALAADLGVGDRVRWWGPQPAGVVERSYARAGVVALPCRIDEDGDRDGLPTVLVEALARGVPVVSTDVVGIPELVRHGETGLIVPPDDPPALARALSELRGNPSLARRLGGQGRDLVRAAYDPAASAAQLQRTWSQVAS